MKLSENIYNHWVTARHIAYLLEDPLEMIEQEAREDDWQYKTLDHYIDYDGQGTIDAVLYDIRSVRINTRIIIAVYLLMSIEEDLSPLLLRADNHADYIGQLFPTVNKDILRASIYRSQQFSYARDILLAFQVHEKDALMIVAEAFCLNRELLYELMVELVGKEDNVFGFLVLPEIHLLRLVQFYSDSSRPLLPEFEQSTNHLAEAIQ